MSDGESVHFLTTGLGLSFLFVFSDFDQESLESGGVNL